MVSSKFTGELITYRPGNRGILLGCSSERWTTAQSVWSQRIKNYYMTRVNDCFINGSTSHRSAVHKRLKRCNTLLVGLCAALYLVTLQYKTTVQYRMKHDLCHCATETVLEAQY